MTEKVKTEKVKAEKATNEDVNKPADPLPVGNVVELNSTKQEAVPQKISPEKAAADTKKKAKKKASGKNAVYTSPDGIKYKLRPVGANLIRDAALRIPDARIRTFTNPESGKEEANLAHPEYIKEQKEIDEERIKASMNAMILFGLKLIDPIPADNEWLQILLYTKLISQAEYDETTSAEGKFLRELFYKNYIVADFNTLSKLSQMSGVTQGDIAQARKSFQSSA